MAKRHGKADRSFLVIILLIALSLSSCKQNKAKLNNEPDISSLSESNISSSISVPSESSSNIHMAVLTLDIENEPPGFENNIAPDFLNEEQQDVYKKAYEFKSALLVESSDIDFPFAEGQTKHEISKDEIIINDVQYYMIQGRYSRWDELNAVMTSIFTEEYYKKRWGDRFITDENGNAMVCSSSRGTNNERTKEPDTFELISKTDKAIEFNVIGYYQSKEDGKAYTKSFTNIMELTNSGWRLSQFEITV